MSAMTLEPTQSTANNTQNNREILRQLEQEQALVEASCYGVSGAMASGVGFILPWLTLGSLPALHVLLNRLKKLGQLIRVVTAIVNAFETEGVEIFPRLEAPGYQPIDLFIRFPDKEFLLISIRSFSSSTIVYNEKLEALQIRRRGRKGLYIWRPDPLTELSEQEQVLRKTRRDLFGGSSRDSRRPLGKVLVMSEGTNVDEHSAHLYRSVETQKWLTVKKRGTTTVVKEDQITAFIRTYLIEQKANKA